MTVVKDFPLILIVENDIHIRKLIREWIEQSSLRCWFMKAGNSKKAFMQVRKHTPDIILMGINMPYVNGIETTRVIHRIMPETRVVMLSIHEEDHIKEEAMRADTVAYVVKREMTIKLIPLFQ